MIKKTQNETMVGLFVIIGFVILTVIVFFVSGVYLFRPGFSLYVMYDYVSILDRGAPVRMAGVRVGEVNKVDLIRTSTDGQTRVRVKLFIEKGVEIGENYLFKIQGTHILSEPHIEITPQTGNAPLIKPDTVIEGMRSVPIEDLIDRSQKIAESLEAILSTFRTAIQDESTAQDIRQLLKNLTTLTHSMNIALSGTEGDMKQTIVDIHTSANALSNIMQRIDKGDGTVGALLTKDELYQEMREFVAEIKRHPWKLLKKDGGRSKFLGIF